MTEIDFVGAKIVSVGYCYNQLVEMTLEQPDGKRERVSFGIVPLLFGTTRDSLLGAFSIRELEDELEMRGGV